MSTVHVLPVADLIEHESGADDCACGPTIEPVQREDGSMGWLITHHSLDGRERSEMIEHNHADGEPSIGCPGCAAGCICGETYGPEDCSVHGATEGES